MSDSGSMNLDLGVNLGVTLDGAGLQELSNTIKEISKGKDLQRYWKDVESATDSAAKAIERYNKNVNSKGLAENLLKQINALKALTKKENLSDLFPNMELNLDELVESAKKIVPQINSQFSVNSFSQAFKTFDLLKEKSIDLTEAFRKLADYAELVDQNYVLRKENNQFRDLIGDSDVEEVKNKLSEVKKLRDEAEDIFESFLKINNIERKDEWGDERFSKYFDGIREGSLTATRAITKFKTECAYLLEEGFKSNNDTFGLEQLQAFSNKLDSIFRQVEETSTKINDIISNGVITKSVENLSMDSSLSDSQRSLFGNLLKDEESLKSITALFQKLIEESNKTSKVDLFNDEQLQQVLSIFDKMEKHLSSLRSIISDVGDGEEFSPLLKMINNVQSSISELAISVKGIGLNMNINVGSDSEMESKVQSKIANALQAYQRLFDNIKMSSTGGQIITDKFFDFDINQYDTMMGKLQAYKKFIDNMRKEAKTQFNGKDVLYQNTEKSYWTQASAAMGQVKKAFNEMKAASDTNPLADMFGKADLSGVISQLGLIVAKLEEISTTASSFKNVFKDGFNVTASVEEINKLTNRVKELEDELSKIKLNPVGADKSNISSENSIRSILPSNSEFKNIISNLDLTKSKLGEIVKITRQAHADKDGKFYESFTLTDRNGSTETYGESSKTSKGQLLNYKYVEQNAKAAEQEAKALNQAWEEANKVNNALNETKNTLSSLPRMTELDTQFTSLDAKLSNLNSELTSGKISVADYKKEVKSLTSEYSKLVTIQQNRDVETYKQNAKAAEQEAKQVQKLAEEKRKLRQQEKQSTQSSVDKALTDQVSAWKQIQLIREKIAKTDNADEINALQESKKYYQEQYNNANKILKANDDLYDKESQIARLEQVRLETNAKLASYKTKQVESLESTVNGYYKDYNNRNIKPTNENRSVEYKQALDKYLTSIKELEIEKNRLSQLSSISDKELSRFRELEKTVQKNANAFKAMSAAQKGSTEASRWKEIDKISKYLEKNTRISKEAKQQLQEYITLLKSGSAENIEEIHRKFNEIAVAERIAGREGKSFLDIFKSKVLHRFASQLAMYYLSFYDFIRYARNAINAVKELDTALIDLKKTTTMSSSELEQFYYDSNDVAKQLGVTTAEIINQASAWSRLGFSTKEASTQMAELSAQFASISPDMDLDTATDGLVSSMKAFDIEVSNVERDIMDNINRIGNTAATSNGEIVDMLTRSSAAMAAANNTIQETIALETAAVEITRNAESTGTAFKTLSMRIRGYDEETEELSDDLKNISGDIADLTKTASTPGGISLFTDETKQTYKSTYQILKEISDIYDELSDKNRAELLEKLAGKRGGQVVAGLLSNFDAAEKAIKEMEGAAGSADAEMSIIEQSLEFKLNALKQTWVGTAQAILERGDFGKVIDGLTKLSEAIGFVVDKAGLLGTIGLGAGIFAGIKNVGKRNYISKLQNYYCF